MRPPIQPLSFYAVSALICVLAIILASVSYTKPGSTKGSIEYRLPVIVGNSDTTTLCLSPAYMMNAWYTIERLDTLTDTLDLSKEMDWSGHRLSYQWMLYPGMDEKHFSNTGIRVIVDTINELSMTKRPIWASYLFHRNFMGKTKEILQDDTLIQQVKSFPIYVVNLSNSDTGRLEVQDGSIMMVVEAKDSAGTWKQIEYWSGSWCGNSYYTKLLPPQHFFMSRGVKCSGDFLTSCRMKVTSLGDSIYSNEFTMSINETQFENPIRKDSEDWNY